MSIARFTPFELLLLKSRSQADTATLLLLSWVLVHRQHVSEGQRRRRLAQVSAQFTHGHELGPVMSIAQSKDLQAIQLAAEVVRKECSQERRLSVMFQAITVATDDGHLSLANHYILRFLADLLNVSHTTLATLFQELTGVALAPPDDPSRDSYWQRNDPLYQQRKEQEAAAAEQAAEKARASAEKRQQAKSEREQQKQQKQQEKQRQREAARDAKARAEQQREREKANEQAQAEQRERQRRQQEQAHARQEQERRQRNQRGNTPPPDRKTRALAVLELSPGASRQEVRKAYRRMAQLHHPDRFYAKSEQQVALASARFQRIKSAYDYLMQTY